MFTPRLSVAIAIGAFILAAGPAEPTAARSTQIASERSTGPEIDFSAVDADGSPVADLQASEVEIRVADRVRTIRNLRRVVAGTGPATRVPAPYGTNDDVAAGRLFAIVVDQESFDAGSEQLFRDAVEGLLSHITAADRAMETIDRLGMPPAHRHE